MQNRGATSLADVPFWRKKFVRMTKKSIPQSGRFLKPKLTTGVLV
jgi:hypothetical protein